MNFIGKNIFLFTFLILFITLNCLANETYSANEIPGLVDISDNKRLNLAHINEFFPIGWSNDGKIAYVENVTINGRPIISYRVVIRDLVINENIWESKFLDVFELVDRELLSEEDLNGFSGDIDSPEFLLFFWKDEIDRELLKAKIVSLNSETILDHNIENIIPIKIEELKKKQELNIGQDFKCYDYFLYNLVYTDSTDETILVNKEIAELMVIEVKTVGYLINPLEESRKGIIVAEYYWDPNGGNHVDFSIIGTDKF